MRSAIFEGKLLKLIFSTRRWDFFLKSEHSDCIDGKLVCSRDWLCIEDKLLSVRECKDAIKGRDVSWDSKDEINELLVDIKDPWTVLCKLGVEALKGVTFTEECRGERWSNEFERGRGEMGESGV